MAEWYTEQVCEGGVWRINSRTLRHIGLVSNREDAEHIVALHNANLSRAQAPSEVERLREIIERAIFAIDLGGEGTIEEANRVERNYGNTWANLYLDLCAAVGRGHRSARPSGA